MTGRPSNPLDIYTKRKTDKQSDTYGLEKKTQTLKEIDLQT